MTTMVSDKDCTYLCFAIESVRNGHCTDDGKCVCGFELKVLKKGSSMEKNYENEVLKKT